MKNLLLLGIMLLAGTVWSQEPDIINTAHVPSSTFNKMWVTRVNLVFPRTGEDGFLQVRLAPFDGTNILANGCTEKLLMPLAGSIDTNLTAMLTDLTAELSSLSTNTNTVLTMTMMAADPAQPIRVIANFSDGKMLEVADCRASAGRDPQFAAVWVRTKRRLAKLAGLTTQ